MNTYAIYDLYNNYLGKVETDNYDAALIYAGVKYGAGVRVIRQYETSAVGFDPMWILLAVLLLGIMTKKKKS